MENRQARANIYGLLSRILLQELDVETLKMIKEDENILDFFPTLKEWAPLVEVEEAKLLDEIGRTISPYKRSEITRVINCTGIIVHTNLGRAPLPESIFDAIKMNTEGYSNIEFNLFELFGLCIYSDNIIVISQACNCDRLSIDSKEIGKSASMIDMPAHKIDSTGGSCNTNFLIETEILPITVKDFQHILAFFFVQLFMLTVYVF